jgi:hypothetical protein
MQSLYTTILTRWRQAAVSSIKTVSHLADIGSVAAGRSGLCRMSEVTGVTSLTATGQKSDRRRRSHSRSDTSITAEDLPQDR